MIRQAIKQFTRSWKMQLVMQLATLSVLTGTFAVFAIAMLVHQNVSEALTSWGREVKVHVYLDEEIAPANIEKISEALDESEMFLHKTFISKADAVQKFKSRMSTIAPSLMKDLEINSPLPASYELIMQSGIQSRWKYNDLVNFAKDLKKFVGVEEVSYGQGWIENYASALRALSNTTWAFLFVLLVGSIFVVGNSIRNSIFQRRDEIEILELFGATRGMITWPYVFEGMVMGLAASIIAIVICYVMFSLQAETIIRELSFWGSTANLQFLKINRILTLLFVGTALGGLGALIWANKISTGWSAAEAAKK